MTTLKDLASVAPLATALIAIAALAVATWSLIAQKGVARRRASVDFFLKVELDDKLIAAYDKFFEGLNVLTATPDNKLSKFAESDHYHDVRSYLNVFELMAAGIESGAFDERICYVMWKSFVIDVMKDCARLIDFMRERDKEEYYFRGFRRLHFRWLNNPELAIRWQGPPARKGPTPTQPIP